MKLLFPLYKIPVFYILLIVIIQSIDSFFSISFSQLGVKPLEIEGLVGILFAPLIHGSWGHALSNISTLVILCGVLFYHFHSASRIIFWSSYFFPLIITWIIGRDSYHIGASGVVYGLMAFLIFIGFFTKKRYILAISFAILFFHSGFLWGIIPQESGISWETHLGGFITGTALAFLFKKFPFYPYEFPKKEIYSPQSSTLDNTISYTYITRKHSKSDNNV
ncbi:MAG: rhomboid family intramembrane serine protease [Bacteroidales bacterium]